MTQAVEWRALVASHPNGEWETKQRAEKALAQLEEGMSPEEFHAAQERGQSAELVATIRDARAWLAVR